MSVPLPEMIELEPALTCNLRCRMCHVSVLPEEPRAVLPAALLDRLESLAGRQFVIGSAFEPLMNPEFPEIIRRLTGWKSRIQLITNGTLLDGEALESLVDADVSLINVSFDGIRKVTYEHIRRNASHGETLEQILACRARFAGRDTRFAVFSTMMRSNLAEIPEIVDFWDAAGFDAIRFITMVVRSPTPELIRESLYPVRGEYYRLLDEAARDVIERPRRISLHARYFAWTPLRRNHPERFHDHAVISTHPDARLILGAKEDLQLGIEPGMWFPCRSPWTAARVLATGDVELCSQFAVGNLHEQSFEEIWNGDRAAAVRRKVATDRTVCPACDFYRFCISRTLNPEDIESHFTGSLRPFAHSVDFDAGTIDLPKLCSPPRLVESLGTWNLVALDRRYVAVPQAAGPIELDKADLSAVKGLIVDDTLQGLRRRVRAA